MVKVRAGNRYAKLFGGGAELNVLGHYAKGCGTVGNVLFEGDLEEALVGACGLGADCSIGNHGFVEKEGYLERGEGDVVLEAHGEVDGGAHECALVIGDGLAGAVVGYNQFLGLLACGQREDGRKCE